MVLVQRELQLRGRGLAAHRVPPRLTLFLSTGQWSIFFLVSSPPRADLLLAQRRRADHAHRGDIDPELGGRHDGGRFTYSYDGAGNVTKELEITGQIITYAWDAENRMTRWEQAGTTHAIKYTGDGKRIELIRTPGIDTRYVWDGENIQNETNLAGLNRDVFTYEPAGYGRLLSVVLQGGTERFLVFDALGSADRLLAVNQSVTDQYLYEAFGKEVLKTGTTRNPFRWLGEIGYYTDNETAGVPVYVRARQYSPVSGRWLSVDPLSGSGTYGLYVYVWSSPVALIDPNGLAPINTPLNIIFDCVCPLPPGFGTGPTYSTRVIRCPNRLSAAALYVAFAACCEAVCTCTKITGPFVATAALNACVSRFAWQAGCT